MFFVCGCGGLLFVLIWFVFCRVFFEFWGFFRAVVGWLVGFGFKMSTQLLFPARQVHHGHNLACKGLV